MFAQLLVVGELLLFKDGPMRCRFLRLRAENLGVTFIHYVYTPYHFNHAAGPSIRAKNREYHHFRWFSRPFIADGQNDSCQRLEYIQFST